MSRLIVPHWYRSAILIILLFAMLYLQSTGERQDVAKASEWSVYEDPYYGFALQYPLKWFLYPSQGVEGGDYATLTSHQFVEAPYSENVPSPPDFVKIEVGLLLNDKPVSRSLREWAMPDAWRSQRLLAEKALSINGVDILSQSYKHVHGAGYITAYYMPRGAKVYFITITTPTLTLPPDAEKVVQSFKFTEATGRSLSKSQPEAAFLFVSEQTENSIPLPNTAPEAVAAPTNFRLPFSGSWIISNGPGEGLHKGWTSNAGYADHAIDFAMPDNTPVLATEEGNVTFANYDTTGYGKSIRIHHDNGLDSWYAHLTTIQVILNQSPRPVKGQQIAISGHDCTPACGAHLHFHVTSSAGAMCILDMPGVWWNTSFPPGVDSLYSGCAVYPPVGLVPSNCRPDARSYSCGGTVGNTYLSLDIVVRDPMRGDYLNGARIYQSVASFTRPIGVDVYDSNNQLVRHVDATAGYRGSTDNFGGAIDLGSNWVTGFYQVRVRLKYTLGKRYGGMFNIVRGQTVPMPRVYLRAGDINDDNQLSILDWNVYLDCYSDFQPARNCASADKKAGADINVDGKVNIYDGNQFLRILKNYPGE